MATSKESNLKSHTQSVHICRRFKCLLCDYEANQNCSLSSHKESVHLGITYPCEQCDYHANNKIYLKNHELSVHIGWKFQCTQYDYHATRKSSVEYHKFPLWGPGGVSGFLVGLISPFCVRINPMWSFRTLNDLLIKIKKLHPRGPGGGGPNLIFLPHFLFIFVRSPSKNLNSYDNPLWNFNYGGKKKR